MVLFHVVNVPRSVAIPNSVKASGASGHYLVHRLQTDADDLRWRDSGRLE